MSINKKADGKIKNVTYFNAQNSMEKIKNIINSTDENTKYFKYARNKMMSVGEPADIRLTQVNANKQTSNSSLLNEILSNHPQKVKPADLTDNKIFQAERSVLSSPKASNHSATASILPEKEILPHQSQKVKPQDLTDGNFKQGLDELSKLDYDKLSSKQKDIYDVFAGKKMQLQSKFKI